MEDDSLQAKQCYMREKILDAGYDAQKFVQFCSARHDLDDLENWSMHELTQIVRDFIQSVSPSAELPPSLADTHNNQQFGHFQQSYLAPTSLPVPVAQDKMGLVFSEDDWNILLASPSIISQHNTSQIPKPNAEIAVLGLSLDSVAKEPVAAENSPKDIPLSPPSSVNPNKGPQLSALVAQQKPKIQQNIPRPVAQQKQQTKIKDNASPINLSNIKITTAKEKSFPPLPPITEVLVTKTEQVTRNFLQGDYTLYHIQFNPSQHTVQRKFTDLRRARAILQRLYPFLRLPFLQPQGWINTSEAKDPQILAKYKYMVEEFLKYVIIKSEDLKNSEVVRILCGFSSKSDKSQVSKEEFKKKLQAYENVGRPKFIGEVVLCNNTIVIPPISHNQKLITQTMDVLNEVDLLYDRLRKQFDILFINYEELQKSLNQLAFTFQSLEDLMKTYSTQNKQLGQFRIFDGIKETVLKLSNRIDTQYGIFKTRIKGLFRYEKQNMGTLKEVIESRNKVNYEYMRRGQPAFTSNKLKLQGQNVEIQSPIALQQPVRNNKNVLAIQEIFWSFMSGREIKRYWEHLRRKIGEQLTLIAYDELDGENDNLNFWNLIIKKCVA